MGIVFGKGPGDLGSIPGCVIPKTSIMALDTALLNTLQYKVRIKGEVEQSRERSSALPLHLGIVAIEKGTFGSLSTTVASFTFLLIVIITTFRRTYRPKRCDYNNKNEDNSPNIQSNNKKELCLIISAHRGLVWFLCLLTHHPSWVI